MDVFDLHCDTLYKSLVTDKPLDSDGFELRISDMKNAENYIQCMAVWTPDDISALPQKYREKPLISFFKAAAEKLISEGLRLGIPVIKDKMYHRGFILTVENSSVIGDRLENIKVLADHGVKLATLTWNERNLIGDGAGVSDAKGLTAFGKDAVREYNRHNIAIDLSHASDALFYDVASVNKGKILASHSNSRSVCGHVRNLTDEQFCYIRDNGGIVGLNFHRYFLRSDGDAGIDDLLRHTEHFLSLGGENTLALGSDFDGSDIPSDISNSGGLVKIYNKFIDAGIPKQITERIFYKNALNFFDNLQICFDNSSNL